MILSDYYYINRLKLRNKIRRAQSFKPGTHWQQSWIQHGRLRWTGNKTATKL